MSIAPVAAGAWDGPCEAGTARRAADVGAASKQLRLREPAAMVCPPCDEGKLGSLPQLPASCPVLTTGSGIDRSRSACSPGRTLASVFPGHYPNHLHRIDRPHLECNIAILSDL
jgi:hypothetical protein